MVTITDSAKEELKKIQDRSDLDPGRFLRLAIPPVWEGEGDFGIVISAEGHADHVVNYKGQKLLLMDPAIADRLSSSIMDFKNSRFSLDVY